MLTWEIKTATLKSRWAHGSNNEATLPQVTCLKHEPNMDLIAAGYGDGSIRIWDCKSETVVVTFNGHKGAVTALEFDKSGTRLASGSKDSNIIVWDLVSEAGLFRLRSHRDQVTGLIFASPSTGNEEAVDDVQSEKTLVNEEEESDRFLISTAKDGLIKLWDLETQYCIETHIAHKSECWALDKHDGRLVTSGSGTDVAVWNLQLDEAEGSKITQLGQLTKQSQQRTITLKFHPNGNFLAVGSSDRSIELWRMRTEDEVKKLLARKKRRRKEKNPTEDEVELETTVADQFANHTVIRAPAKTRGFDWIPNAKRGRVELVVSLANNSLEAYSVDMSPAKNGAADYARTHSIELGGHRTDIRSVSISSDDRMVASASNGTLKVWNLRTRNCLRTFECGYALCTSFLPGNALVVAGTKSGQIELFDLASSTILETIDAHDGELWSLHVSADGTSMVTGGADKKVKFWEFRVSEDAATGQNKLRLKHKRTLELTDDVLCVRFSPDGKLVAASLLDNTIKVFFADTLKFYLNLYGHKLPVLSLDISHDSKLLISSSADKNIKIWGLDFGDCHRSIFAHEDSILCVAFERDSHNFFSASKDKMVKYWDGDKFENVQKLWGHHSEVWTLAVGHGSNFVVSGSHDKSIRVWEQTDEPLFLEEEREKELEQVYESTLTASLEEENRMDVSNGQDEEGDGAVESATKQTIETLKAGEKLMEAIEIGVKDLEADPSEPRNVILAALNVDAYKYVYDVIAKIKPAQCEDALLVLPFDKVVQLLRFVQKWVTQEYDIEMISRVLTTTLRIHHKQIVADKPLRTLLDEIRQNHRNALTNQKDTIGYNLAGLEQLKRYWQLNHNKQFLDDQQYKEEQERLAKKRVFTTV